MDGDSLTAISAFTRFEDTWKAEGNTLLQKLLGHLPLFQVDCLRNDLKRILPEQRIVTLHKE